MSYTRVSGPDDEPITVASARAHLNETSTDYDAYIASLLPVVREAAEARTGQSLVETTWRRTLDDWPWGGVIQLERGPVIAIDSIKYLDGGGVLQTLDPSVYVVDTDSRPARITPAYGLLWPVIRCQIAAIQIQFRAGYADESAIPTRITQWMKLALTDLFENRGRSSDRPQVPQDFAEELLNVGETVWMP